MRSMTNIGLDIGILTREEVKAVETAIVEQIHEHLIGRDIFELVRVKDAGFLDYKYYEEVDMGPASISRYGVAQSDDITMYYSNEVVLPVIDKTFVIQWRDILASRHQGPSLMEQYPRNAARQIAEEEDQLLLSGDHTGWRALGIAGLVSGAGGTAAAAGAWPTNAFADINTARIALENQGFIGTEGILIGQPAAIKCLDQLITNQAVTYRQALLDNGLVRAIYESRNVFSATHGTDTVLLVIPGRENFYMVEALPPTVHWWYDKMGNAHGLVREVVAPVIARAEAIRTITAVPAVCA